MTEMERAIRELVDGVRSELDLECCGADEDELLADLAILECVLRRICERFDS